MPIFKYNFQGQKQEEKRLKKSIKFKSAKDMYNKIVNEGKQYYSPSNTTYIFLVMGYEYSSVGIYRDITPEKAKRLDDVCIFGWYRYLGGAGLEKYSTEDSVIDLCEQIYQYKDWIDVTK